MDRHIRRFAERIELLEKNARRASSTPQLGTSSIHDGTVLEYNAEETLTGAFGKQTDGTHTVVSFNGPTPPAPTAPTVGLLGGAARVLWDGQFADGAVAPLDLARIDVHIFPDGVDPMTTPPRFSIMSQGWGDTSTPLVPESYRAVLVSWTQSGMYAVSAQSDEFTVKVEGVISLTNLCSDPKPTNYLNWLGGSGGGTGIFGAYAAPDSTYAAQGLGIRFYCGDAGYSASFAPNGNSFEVSPVNGSNVDIGFLGATAKTYRFTQSLDISVRHYSPSVDSQINVLVTAYDEGGVRLGWAVTGVDPTFEIYTAGTFGTFRTRLDFADILAQFPTVHSILPVFTYFVDTVAYAPVNSYAGSCMVVATGALPDGVYVYRDPDSAGFVTNADGSSTGDVDLRAIPEYDDIKNKPNVFYVAPPPVEVASEAAMLDLTALVAQVAVRTDVGETYELAALPASTLANWMVIGSTGGAAGIHVPLTTVVGGEPVLVWDNNNELVLTEVIL